MSATPRNKRMEGPLADWFARRTFHTDDFDIADLRRRKEEAGTTVSVVLPSFNEADTVAGVIQAVRELEGTLIDEIVLIDGGSGDDTADIAAAAGARVHQDADVLPDLGPTLGKGDALWRSLTVTTGDIVVFVDTDIRNPDPRFVWGLLGPLLVEPQVQLVKAFYERPVQMGDVLHATGGGRVTELMARPLLNLFWPELAGLVQPLSGEYAGRRELLESIPFFTGYGVEIGMLVDTLAGSGIDAIAQVDVSERVHRNQAMDALSRMAYGIVQVAIARLADEGRLPRELAEASERYVQFVRDERGRIQPAEREVPIIERPPLRQA
ncbi:MAG TPA: glucosyl-3-phosphoglycerate synthase [Egibacteraceae bacterium]|nr:glucosyl-3-phosphoglycerate synthase [Egibacteraceae bacterium]